MALSDTFKTDLELEAKGVAVDVGATNADGTQPQIILARVSKANKEYQKAMTKAVAPFQRELQMKMDVSEKLEAAFIKVFAATIIKGWNFIPLSDVTGNDGKNGRELDEGYAPFSQANALALITRLPDLYTYLQEQADSAALFRESVREESAKN
jgi:hypothetical protein